MENNIIEDNILTIDSTDSRMKIISIEGNKKQDTREGYNLVNPLAKKNVGNNGVTVDFKENGSIVFNGTSNGLGAWLISDDINYEPGEKYTMIVDIIKGTVTNSEFGWGILIYPYVAENAIKILDTSSGRITNSFTFPNDTEISQKNIYLWFGETEEGATFDDFTIKIMIVKGENVVDKEFELYGAMPSFDYPSEVKCVGDNINIFDGETELGGFNGGTGDKTNSSTTIRNKNPIHVKGLNKIIFSCNSEPQALNFYEYDKNNSFLKYTKLAKNKYLELDTNTEYVNFSRNNNIDVSKIKLESGEKITDYSKFGQGNLHLKVLNKNFIDISKNASVTKGRNDIYNR